MKRKKIKLSELRTLVKKIIKEDEQQNLSLKSKAKNILSNTKDHNKPQHSPTKPDTDTKPGTAPSQPDRRRRITPGPDPSVRPQPKALFEKDDILKKIVGRFQKEKVTNA